MKAKQTALALALGLTVSFSAMAATVTEKAENLLVQAGNYVFEKALDGAQFLLDSVVPSAHAAIDTTAVQTSLTAAQTSGEDVGEIVIGVVAGLVVVGIIIGMVKKL